MSHLLRFFHICLSLSLPPLQSSELDDILNDLQNAQPQLFCELRPVSLPSPMDKQNIINDILQMSESNPALAAQQQHRGIAASMGPSSKSHIYVMNKVTELVILITHTSIYSQKRSPSSDKRLLKVLLLYKLDYSVFFTIATNSFLYLQTLGMYDRVSQAGLCQ